MLAKLSGIPISTQISSVTAPATSSGTSVSSTSVIRRSASQSRRLIDDQRLEAGVDERLHDGVAGFRIETGPPIAFGSAASTAPANLRSVSLSLGSPRGSASTRCSPSLVFHALHEIGRQSLQADRLGLQRILQLLEHDLQRADEDRLRLVARGLDRTARASSARRPAAATPPRPDPCRRRRLCAGSPADPFNASTFSSSDGGCIDGVRIERGIEHLGALRDQLQLRRLIRQARSCRAT